MRSLVSTRHLAPYSLGSSAPGQGVGTGGDVRRRNGDERRLWTERSGLLGQTIVLAAEADRAGQDQFVGTHRRGQPERTSGSLRTNVSGGEPGLRCDPEHAEGGRSFSSHTNRNVKDR